MSVLGTMMLRAGLLSESQVAAANQQAAAKSSSHVDAILELGLADEDTLVAFLASKLMIPRVRSSLLERVDAQTIARLAPLLAWDFKCVPVSIDEIGNLTVAMADPTDERAIQALTQQSRTYLVRAVGSASDLRRALERHYGPEHQVRERAASGVGVTEADRATELELQPVRDDRPPSYENSAQRAPVAQQAPVAQRAPVAPYMSIGTIPTDDDDDVPIRNTHAVAEEINSGPLEQADEPEPAMTAPVAAPYVAAPPVELPPPAAAPPIESPPAAAPYIASPPVAAPYVTSPAEIAESDDSHERPTVVETHPSVGPHAGRGPRRPRAHTPWNPPLADFNSEPAPLSPEAFARILPTLEAVNDRDEVTTLLLDFLAAGFNRVILFVHSHNELRGLDARGRDLLVEAVRQVRIPSTGQSMFASVLERGTPYFGPAPSESKIDLAFSQALGGIKGNVLLLPITLGSKVPLLLWAHGTNHAVDPGSINELSSGVSTAILRIISAARRR